MPAQPKSGIVLFLTGAATPEACARVEYDFLQNSFGARELTIIVDP